VDLLSAAVKLLRLFLARGFAYFIFYVLGFAKSPSTPKEPNFDLTLRHVIVTSKKMEMMI